MDNPIMAALISMLIVIQLASWAMSIVTLYSDGFKTKHNFLISLIPFFWVLWLLYQALRGILWIIGKYKDIPNS